MENIIFFHFLCVIVYRFWVTHVSVSDQRQSQDKEFGDSKFSLMNFARDSQINIHILN